MIEFGRIKRCNVTHSPVTRGGSRTGPTFLFSIYDLAIICVSKIYAGIPNLVAAAAYPEFFPGMNV